MFKSPIHNIISSYTFLFFLNFTLLPHLNINMYVIHVQTHRHILFTPEGGQVVSNQGWVLLSLLQVCWRPHVYLMGQRLLLIKIIRVFERDDDECICQVINQTRSENPSNPLLPVCLSYLMMLPTKGRAVFVMVLHLCCVKSPSSWNLMPLWSQSLETYVDMSIIT